MVIITPYFSPLVSAKANVYLVQVKLDPEWLLLGFHSVEMSLFLFSATFPFPCSLAMAAAALEQLQSAEDTPRHRAKGLTEVGI